MKNFQINNRPELKENRRQLRNNSTPAEAFLWNYLKNKQLAGRKFRRQFSVENYILDFYCPSEKLCIELDGADHFTSAGFEYDQERTAFLNNLGIKVIRFENKTVFDATEYVLETIMSNFKDGIKSLSPSG
jgi:very-short-patch-repair endonuclease